MSSRSVVIGAFVLGALLCAVQLRALIASARPVVILPE